VSSGKRWLVVVGAVAGAAIATKVYWTPGDGGSGPAATSPAETLERGDSALERTDPRTSPAAEESAREAPTAERANGHDQDASASGARGIDAEPSAGATVAKQSAPPAAPETVRRFGSLDLPEAGPIQDKLRQFAAEPLDPVSSTNIEARLLSAIAQSSVAVVDWHVECRSSTCVVLAVYPFGTDSIAVAKGIENVGRALGPLRGPSTVFFFPRGDGAPAALGTFGIPRESTPQSAPQASGAA